MNKKRKITILALAGLIASTMFLHACGGSATVPAGGASTTQFYGAGH